MAEGLAFANMLQNKEISDKFDLHKIDRDSNGVEKAHKVDKDAVAQKTKMSAMAQEVIDAIYQQTFSERIRWIEDQRKIGNELFKQEKYPEAIDEYMKCLCALDFKSCRGYVDQTTEKVEEKDKDLDPKQWITREKETMAQMQMKIPCLNNMAQSLIKMTQYSRAIDMLDQVLELDAKNCKAVARKILCMMKLGHHTGAEKLVTLTANTIDSFNRGPPADLQMLKETVNSTKRELAQKAVDDKKFMQNVLKKSGQLYGDKKDIKTEEEKKAEEEERKIVQERMDEAEYLETLSTFHWFVYPWFKLIETACDKVFGCKRKLDEENAIRRAEVQEKQVAKEAARRKQMEEMLKKQEMQKKQD